jgi:hypothetical protein
MAECSIETGCLIFNMPGLMSFENNKLHTLPFSKDSVKLLSPLQCEARDFLPYKPLYQCCSKVFHVKTVIYYCFYM